MTQDLQLLAQKRAFPLLVTVAPEQIDAGQREGAGGRGRDRQPRPHGGDLRRDRSGAGRRRDRLHAPVQRHAADGGPQARPGRRRARSPGKLGRPDPRRHSCASASARAAFAAKTARRLMLVSDAMATVGSKDASMSLFGEKISVSDGALRTASGTLAGAHLELSAAVRNAVAMLGATTDRGAAHGEPDAGRIPARRPASAAGSRAAAGPTSCCSGRASMSAEPGSAEPRSLARRDLRQRARRFPSCLSSSALAACDRIPRASSTASFTSPSAFARPRRRRRRCSR